MSDMDLERWTNENLPNESMNICRQLGLDEDAIERAARLAHGDKDFPAEHFRTQAGYERSALRASDERSREQYYAAGFRPFDPSEGYRPPHGGYPGHWTFEKPDPAPEFPPEDYDGA